MKILIFTFSATSVLVVGQPQTIVLVDQEIRQALKIADYVYVLELGRKKFEGPVEEFSDLEKAFPELKPTIV